MWAFGVGLTIAGCGVASAQAVNVVQVQRANVFGLVQVGPQAGPVTVSQTGQANIAGVMQVGANPRTSITQNGRANAAFVSQFQSISTPTLRQLMP